VNVPADEVSAPELPLLAAVLGPDVALRLATHPGGWRTLSAQEIVALGLEKELGTIVALQELVRHGYPRLAKHRFTRSEQVAAVYSERLGGLDREVMVAVALDGKLNLLAEIEIATGGHHGIAVTPADVFRPLIRSGASAFVLVHNHPSGDPTPSREDIAMTQAVVSVGVVVGIELLDHVIVGARGGGWSSLMDLGLMGDTDETRFAHQTVPS
jgi:DNA repair protein RadC